MIKILIESSKSRTGKHAFRALFLVIDTKGRIVEPRIERVEPVKPRYVIGKASKAYITLNPNEYGVQIELVKNLRNEVKGFISVINSEGKLLLKVKYVREIIRRSLGDPKYGWIIERVLDYLKIPYKRINLRTGL